MMRYLNIFLIAALVVVPAAFGVAGKSSEMAIATVAIALALSFANIERFVRFKGLGFEAELRTVVEKAYAAIAELKELGLCLSSPIVDGLAVSGRMLQYIHLRHKLESVEKIVATLKKLGATPPEIAEVTGTIMTRVTHDHLDHIFYALQKANGDKVQVLKALGDERMHDWDNSRIDHFIAEHALVKDSDTVEAMLDLDFFRENKKLRRNEVWQS